MDWREDYKRKVCSPEEAVKKNKIRQPCGNLSCSWRASDCGGCNGAKL